MPSNKDFKRLIRTRMRKTGESYTTARAHLLKHNPTRPAAAPAPLRPSDLERLAGMSNEAVQSKTGCAWDKWVFVLDHYGAADLPHREIARLVREKYKIGSWWAQTVTVGYERIRGLREKGQRRDGAYEAGKTRTFPVPVRTLYRAFRDARVRRRWLEEPVTVRATQPDKSVRFGWGDGTIVAVSFTAKGRAKATASVQHMKLADRAAVERWKVYWADRLATLAERLG